MGGWNVTPLEKGQRFGKWITLSRDRNANGQQRWTCRCDCGKSRSVLAKYLRNGQSKSCGCALVVEIKKGDRFGKLTVTELASTKSSTLWNCRCDCGGSRVVLGTVLKRGLAKRCKSCRTIHPRKGERFGNWTAIERIEDETVRQAPRWLCRCDCGATRSVLERSLRTGGSTSCRCKGKQKPMKGQRFGRLTVVDEPKETVDNKWLWPCECDCGASLLVEVAPLRNGKVTSCGCKGGKRLVVNGRRLGATQLAALFGFKDATIRSRLRKCQGKPTIEEILRPAESKHRKAK